MNRRWKDVFAMAVSTLLLAVALASPATVAIDAGGPGDQYYNASTTFTSSGVPAPYNTRRGSKDHLGTLTYDIPLPNGTYAVTFQWYEGWATQVGQRVLDLRAEGTVLASNLDIYQEAGQQPYDRTYEVTVADGSLTVDFIGVVDRGWVSGILVEPVAAPAPPPASPTPATVETDALAWEYPENPDPSPTGFEVGCGLAAGDRDLTRASVDGPDARILPLTAFTNPALEEGQTYFCAVRAVTLTPGLVSEWSNEVAFTVVEIVTPPPPPTFFRIVVIE